MTTSLGQEQATHSTRSAERFQAMVSPEIEVLYRVACTITQDPSEAETLVKETITRAYASIDTVDENHPRAWLLATMRTAQTEGSFSAQSIESSRTAAKTPLGSELAGLPQKSRKIVELVDLDKLSYHEAASVLGISVSVLKTRLHQARTALVRNLDPVSFAI